MRSTRAVINLSAIRHNFDLIHQLTPRTKIMGVLKADAYGHGIEKVGAVLGHTNIGHTDAGHVNPGHADAIAVACMDEAIRLRNAGIDTPIILLEGFFSERELIQVIEYKLITIIHHQQQLAQFLKLDTRQKVDVWLKYDSGMNRLGFSAEEFVTAFQAIKQHPSLGQLGLMSHLACADDIGNGMTQRQIRMFKKLANELDPGKQLPRSMANSAGVIAWPEGHFDWIRPGLILYGCSPLAGKCGVDHHLIPAMNLESQLFAIKSLHAGETVGYSAAWKAPEETQIGIIAIGYGDGYPRHARPGTPVWIDGKTYPLVGKVSMDMIAVDLGLHHALSLGERVVLWGEELPVEVVAEHADTIPYTLLCGVTSRVKFEWVEK